MLKTFQNLKHYFIREKFDGFSEEEIFDYVEKNLPKKLEEMKKIIDANSELKEKVSNIEKGMAISIELARHEEERSELNFDGIMEEAEKK